MKGFTSITRTTSEQAQRKSIYYFITVPFALLALLTPHLVLFVFEGKTEVMIETGLVTVSACGIFLSLFLSWLLVRKEMERMSILTILSKPVSPASFVLGKFSGLSLAIFKSLLFVFLMFLLGIWWYQGGEVIRSFLQHNPPPIQASEASLHGLHGIFEQFYSNVIYPSLLGLVPLLFQVYILLSLVVTSSLFFQILPVSGILVSYVILGAVSGQVFQAFNQMQSVVLKSLGWGFRLLVPDFQMMNVSTVITQNNAQLVGNLSGFLLLTCLSGLLYIFMWLAIGFLFFQNKEIT